MDILKADGLKCRYEVNYHIGEIKGVAIVSLEDSDSSEEFLKKDISELPIDQISILREKIALYHFFQKGDKRIDNIEIDSVKIIDWGIFPPDTWGSVQDILRGNPTIH